MPAGTLHAVQGVSFHVDRGETLCIVGESGCGKTLTALAVMDLLPARAERSARRLELAGRDLKGVGEREMSEVRGAQMAMVFQDPMTSLNPTYSIGNQLLAWAQCLERGLQPGPLATYPRWKELGRYVRKGEKALTLCMPVIVKRKMEQASDTDDAEVFTRFVYRPNWFTLAQTEGQPLAEQPIPD